MSCPVQGSGAGILRMSLGPQQLSNALRGPLAASGAVVASGPMSVAPATSVASVPGARSLLGRRVADSVIGLARTLRPYTSGGTLIDVEAQP